MEFDNGRTLINIFFDFMGTFSVLTLGIKVVKKYGALFFLTLVGLQENYREILKKKTIP